MKAIILFIYLLLFATNLQGLMLSEPDIQAQLDQSKIPENEPIRGMISITHDQTHAIDTKSFTADGKPLEVELDHEAQMSSSSPIVVSFYKFALPGAPAGLYLLPSIKVKIGKKIYGSIPTTYEVEKLKTEPATNVKKNAPPKPSTSTPSAPSSQNSQKTNSSLKLELKVTGTPLLYPKQHFQIIYKYLFNDNIELTEEKLSLIDPVGFEKIGAKETKEYQEKEWSIQQITQTLEAVNPGDYPYEGSEIKGKAYQLTSKGSRIYRDSLLESSTPPITLHVVPFPVEKKPPSFNGAIGPFDIFNVKLGSPPTQYVGDKILLNIDIGGKGQVETVSVPELCCQPGFSGIFQLSDLPPSEQINGTSKHFVLEMRALTTLVKEIPSIEFSYFVPETGKYEVLKSDPIPIVIKPVTEKTLENKPESTQPLNSSKFDKKNWKPSSSQLPAIEIIGNRVLTSKDLYPLLLGTWQVLLLIPLGLILIGIQIKIKKIIESKKLQVKVKTSRDYFEEALLKSQNPSEFYLLLNEAFLKALKEKDLISSNIISSEMLSLNGIQGEVREFLQSIERSLFGGVKEMKEKEWVDKAKVLFKKVQG